jgi:branched-chain amino acid transport system ATP-binding protein
MSLLEVRGLVAGYNRVPVLHEVDLTLEEGQLLAVIGANGAGKSTLMRTIAGLSDPMAGSIVFDGADVSHASTTTVTRRGIAQVPENRRVFAEHSVEENLMLGAYARGRDRKALRSDLNGMFESFPILHERRTQSAGTLSGGEQQMLAIAMALMARPRLLMLDEPSLGLAPKIVEQVFDQIRTLRENGTTILLNEQLANKALAIADRGLVLHLGHVIADGEASELLRDEVVRAAYLGAKPAS